MDIQTALQTAREITLTDICETFVDEELLATSRETQTWYRSRLRLFTTALGPDRPLSSITKKELLDWWRTLEARTRTVPRDLAPDTFHGYVRAARRLYKWLWEQHLTDTELWKALKLPDLPRRQRKGVDDAVVSKMLALMAENPRDLALILLLESTGARRGGMATLSLSDLDLSAPEPHCRRIIVHEKGNKFRTVIMSAEALAALRAWMAARQSSTQYVFTDSRPGYDRGLLPGAVNQIIARYQKRLGIKGKCSPHQWRHRYSRKLLKNGMPLNLASQLLGHSSIVVTAMFYGDLLVDELQQVYDRYYQPPE